MSARIENGLVIGNTYDKYGSNNPIARRLMNGFLQSLSALVNLTNAKTIHEVGCGEGHLSNFINSQKFHVRGTDVSKQVILDAQRSYPDIDFVQKSIYDLEGGTDHADLVVCCEVLEHLENPELALDVLSNLNANSYIFSVPREPIWRCLNMSRGKYLTSFGNTPGHLNHWSTNSFITFIETSFHIEKVLKPLPWTMILCSCKRDLV